MGQVHKGLAAVRAKALEAVLLVDRGRKQQQQQKKWPGNRNAEGLLLELSSVRVWRVKKRACLLAY